MANIKFSQFTLRGTPIAGDEVVGYNGNANIRIPYDAFATAAQGALADSAVQTVNGESGPAITLDTGDIPSVVDARYVTDSDLTNLSNLSGTNTGDQTTSGVLPIVVGSGDTDPVISVNLATPTTEGTITGAEKTKLDNLSGINTGDQTTSGTNPIQVANGGTNPDITLFGTTAEFNAALSGTDFVFEAPQDGTQYGRLNGAWTPVAAGGAPLTVQDEGITLSNATTLINFVGPGVTATQPSANEIEVTITGGGGGAGQLSDLSDVGTVNYTDRHVLVANGTDYNSRALVAEDVSDFNIAVADNPDVAANSSARDAAPFWYKSGPTIPIVIFSEGQSNISMNLGGQYTTPKSANPNVQVWHGSDAANSLDDGAFTDYDPTAPQFSTGVNNRGMGYVQNQYGSYACDLAEELHERTGRDVYVIQVYRDGTTIQRWDPDTSGSYPADQEMQNFPREQCAKAIAWLQANVAAEIEYADIWIWGQSDKDMIDGMPNDEYVERWKRVRADRETAVISPGITQILLQEPSSYWWRNIDPDDGSAAFVNTLGTLALQHVDKNTGEEVTLMTSTEYTEVPSQIQIDQIHFTADTSLASRQAWADHVLGTGTSKTVANPEFGEDKWLFGKDLNDSLTIKPRADGQTFTAPAPPMIDGIADYVVDGASPVIRQLFQGGGTITVNAASAGSGVGAFIDTGLTTIAFEGNNSIGGAPLLVEGTILKTNATSGTVNTAQAVMRSITIGKQYSINPGVTLNVNAVEDMLIQGGSGFLNQGTLNVDSRAGIRINTFAGFGVYTLERQAGVHLSAMVSGDNNTHVLFGQNNIPDGDWGVYQGNNYPNRWGGGQAYSARQANGNTTLTAADQLIRMTNAAAANVTLPLVADLEIGTEFRISRIGSGSINIVPTGGDSIRAFTFGQFDTAVLTAWGGSTWDVSVMKAGP